MSVTSLNFCINESAFTRRRWRRMCFFRSLRAGSHETAKGSTRAHIPRQPEPRCYNLKVLIAISASREAIAKEAVAAGDGALST